MRGHELAIEKNEVTGLQAGDEPRQCDLRCVGPAAEHRFTEEGATQADAIDPADQLAIGPAFDRVGVARRVKSERGAFDIGVDPRFGAVGAATDDVFEGAVARDLEAAAPDCLR